nr:hypothetical protein [uncultured Hyphomonas sp.]
MSLEQLKIRGYTAGHPWFYVLGGPVLPPKAIMAEVAISKYRGWMRHDIEKADALAEPKRSAELRKFREKILIDLRRDLSGYREAAFELHTFRRMYPESSANPFHDDAHTAVSLKFSHLFNDFAHLTTLDDLLAVQRDLFAQ